MAYVFETSDKLRCAAQPCDNTRVKFCYRGKCYCIKHFQELMPQVPDPLYAPDIRPESERASD